MPPTESSKRWNGHPRLRVAAALLIVALVGGGAAMWRVAAWWQAPGPLAVARTLVIGKGGVRAIGQQLAASGIVDHPWLFVLMARLSGAGTALKAGEYAFAPASSPASVASLLESGKTIVHRLVIPEGLTTPEALAVIDGADALAGNAATPPGEGLLLPGTYFYSHGDLRQKLVDTMTRDMRRTVSTLWAARAAGLPVSAPEQAVILASIVEKETALPAERPLIAGVFYNRLRRGMRLQADPTIVYALTSGRHALGRPLSHDDLALISPYNTYLVGGLPPGPIANPGKAALDAVLHPQATDALYFVADGDGGHVFAATLDAHNRNVGHLRRRTIR